MRPIHILRYISAIILLAHSIPTMLDGSINDFGRVYLSELGFGNFGLTLAWVIKIIHVLGAISLVLNRYLPWTLLPNIAILLFGILILHLKEGWYVVGPGRNGVEFNILLIAVLSYLLLRKRKKHHRYKSSKKSSSEDLGE